VVRRFAKDAPLAALFRWAAGQLPEDRPFDLKLAAPPFTSMRRALDAARGSAAGATLESAGCCSARLHAEWL
jgi:hypothetical protein